MKTMQMLAMAAFCAAAATGWARTMSVTSNNRTSATLAFGEPDGNNYTLCLAYGEVSGGDDKYKWASFAPVGTIAADQTTATYSFPNELTSGMFYRFFLLQTENLPYVRELEFIQSSGSQFIDTGITGTLGIKMETNFVWMKGSDTTIMGARTGSNMRFYGAYMYSNWGDYKSLAWGYGYANEWNYFTSDSTYGVATNNTFHVVHEAKTNLRNLVVNGKEVYRYTGVKGADAFNTGRNMYIFGCNKDGAFAMAMTAKLFDMKIWQNDVLVRSYRPVALASGDGALYDEVTETIFANGGSTPFVLGKWPDGDDRLGIVRAMSPVIEMMTEEEAQELVTSYWVGGVDGDLAKDGNWRSINRGGDEVALAPNSTTVVHFSGTVNACWVGESSTLGAEKIICDNVHLAGNCDWRVFGSVPFEGHLNLNGWKLQLSGLTGTVAITDRPLVATGFEALDYIESTGNACIDSGVKGAPGATVEIDMMGVQSMGYDLCVVGSRKGGMRFLPFWAVHNSVCFGYNVFKGGNNYGRHANDEFVQGKRYVGYNRMRDGSQNTYMNGLHAHHGDIAGEYDTDLNMYIFAMNWDGKLDYSSAIRLYAARFWTGGGAQLARDFVPVKRIDDGALGLYDKVDGEFHAKLGTGALTAGATVASSGSAGELWVDVPEGVTNVNTGVVIAGSTKLVKSGKGVFRTMVLNQTYTGGTSVADGIIDQGVNSANDSMPMGQNEVTVVFDKVLGAVWDNEYHYTWETRPANTTFVLSPSMQSRGYILTEKPDGIFIKAPKLYILIR